MKSNQERIKLIYNSYKILIIMEMPGKNGSKLP